MRLPLSHRRLALAGVALLIALGAAGQVADGVSTGDLHRPGSVVASGAQLASWVRSYGYQGTAGGSLAADRDFLTAVRTRVATLSAQRQAPARLAGGAGSVLVLWAGDRDGRRIALVGYQPHSSAGTEITLALLSGAAGARPAQLRFGAGESLTLGDDLRGTPASLTFGTGAGSSIVFVVAPGAHQVQLARNLEYLPSGRIQTQWQPLQHDGDLVWLGTADRATQSIGRMQVNGQDLAMSDVSRGTSADLAARLQPVAVAGTDPDGLTRAASALDVLAPSQDETPVAARSSVLGTGRLTVAVLRSAEDGYLIGWSMDRSGRGFASGQRLAGASLSSTPAASPRDLLAAAQLSPATSSDRVPIAVIAPRGAVTVRSGSVSAPVHGRLAVLMVSHLQADDLDATQTTARVDALDRSGTVIASTRAAIARTTLGDLD